MKERLKRGETYMYNEKQVWVEHQVNSVEVVVCDNKERNLEDNYMTVRISQLKEVKFFKPGIQKTKHKKLSTEDKEQKEALNRFFFAQIQMIPAYCEECGKPLIGYHTDELRGIIAHILPKSPNSGFPEVATHPLNRMFLGSKCGCHSKWDSNNGLGRERMKVYPVAVDRFKKFKQNVKPNRIIKAYTYLNIKWQ